MTTPKTCGNCRSFGENKSRPASSRCRYPMPNCVVETDLISPWTVACDCPCYQPTPLVASIGRNEAVQEMQS